MLKCNLDVALFPHQNTFGVGICIRNAKFEFVGSKSFHNQLFLSPKEEEATCLMEALMCIHDEGFQRVTIKSDWKAVVDNIKGPPFFIQKLLMQRASTIY